MKKTVVLIIIIFLSQMSFASAFYLNNSLVLQNSTQPNIKSLQHSNYIIITTSELEESIKDFKSWKEYLGFSVTIVNISWISYNYKGRDLQEQIRNFLINKYEEFGIDYVLIVGSRNNIPMRRCDPITWDFGEYLYSDYYYSDITGNWDLDEDGKYAEYGDDEIDFSPEISVGRIPSDDKETVAQICENIVQYGSDSGSWKKNVLLLGAISYYQGLESYGWVYNRSDCATIMEECRIDILDPKDFNYVRMYEAEGIKPSTYDYEFPLEHSNVLSEWTNNYSIVNMIGHSNENLAARWIWDHDDGDNIPEVGTGELIYKNILTKSDSQILLMEKPPIVFSGGCSQLHGPNNIGRSFIENNAAVAYIGTTDLGFYNITRVWNDESDGGFASINYYFFYYLISKNQTCGDALSNSKLYFSNHFMFNEYNPEWIYRCYSTLLGTTLYGDPGLYLNGSYINHPPNKPEIYGPLKGKPGDEYTYYASTTDPDGDNVSYLFSWGNNFTSFIKGPYPSGMECNATSVWFDEGTFNVTVKAIDVYGAESKWSDPLEVSMSKTKIYNPKLQLLFRMLERFPFLNKILNQIL